MVRSRLTDYRTRVRAELEGAFREHHSDREIAASFSVGVFITALPTLGTGFIVFLLLVLLVDRVSKVALLASVVVLNPIVKWGVYLSSFWIGSRILGPVPRHEHVSITDLSFQAAPEIVVRILIGNVILAVVFAVLGYTLVLRLVREYRRRDLEVSDLVPDVILE